MYYFLFVHNTNLAVYRELSNDFVSFRYFWKTKLSDRKHYLNSSPSPSTVNFFKIATNIKCRIFYQKLFRV